MHLRHILDLVYLHVYTAEQAHQMLMGPMGNRATLCIHHPEPLEEEEEEWEGGDQTGWEIEDVQESRRGKTAPRRMFH